MDNAFSLENGVLNYYEIARVLEDHNEKCHYRNFVEDEIKAGCFIIVAYFNFDRTLLAVEIYKEWRVYCALFTKRTLAEVTTRAKWDKWFTDLTFSTEEKEIVLDALASLVENNTGWEDIEEKLFSCDPLTQTPITDLDNLLRFMATEGWYDEPTIEELWQRAMEYEGKRIAQQEIVVDHQNNTVSLREGEEK